MKISKEAIEAGARVLRSNGVGLSAFEMVGLILEAALPHLQDCKVSPQTVQSPHATATQVAVDDAEVRRVMAVLHEAGCGHLPHFKPFWESKHSNPHDPQYEKYERAARAAIRAIREGGQRWGVWNCDSLSQDNAWYWWRKNHGERRHFVTFDEEAAHAMVNQLNADCNSDKYEVRPYPGEREKTAEEIAIGELQDIADNGLRCDTNPTIQITTSANDTALRYVKYIELVDATMRDRAAKALAAIRDAKGGK